MASYEYSGNYYGSYYLFVPDSDTVTGTESTGTVKFAVSSSDTSSAADAVTRLNVKPAAGDSGSAIEAGSIPSHIADADTGSGTDNAATVGVSDDDFTNNYEVDVIVSADTASASDLGVALSPVSSDSWSGTDTILFLTVPDYELSLAFDQAQAFPVGLRDTDTASAAEATGYLPAFPFSSSDTGSAAETGFALPDIQDSDAATGADSQSLVVHLTDTDSGTGADSGGPLVPVSGTDTATALDTGIPVVVGADAGSAAELLLRTGVAAADSATGTENAGFPDNPYGHDFATAADNQSLVAHVSSADAAQWTEVSAHATPSWLLYGTLESFSLVRASVLNGSGLEAAQLYGVRSGQVSPTYGTYPSAGDDINIMVWADLQYVTIEVEEGFLPFLALTTIYGYPVSSAGQEYSVPWGVTPHQASMPMVLRANGRNYLGQPRTFDLVFYHVQFITVGTQRSYKTGMTCDYTAIATYSTVDEAGNALTQPEVGRMVDSPGQLTGAVGALYGRGT